MKSLLTPDETATFIEFKRKADENKLTESDMSDFFTLFCDKNVQAFKMLSHEHAKYIKDKSTDSLETMKEDLLDYIFVHKHDSNHDELDDVSMIITDHNWLMLLRNLTIPADRDLHRPTLILNDSVIK